MKTHWLHMYTEENININFKQNLVFSRHVITYDTFLPIFSSSI
jgi:hypothetical protein